MNLLIQLPDDIGKLLSGSYPVLDVDTPDCDRIGKAKVSFISTSRNSQELHHVQVVIHIGIDLEPEADDMTAWEPSVSPVAKEQQR